MISRSSAHPDHLPWRDAHRALHAPLVHEGAVAALEILDPDASEAHPRGEVPPRDGLVEHHDVVHA